MRHAESATGVFFSGAINGIGTANYVTQTSSKTTINIKGLAGTFTGLNTGAGPFYMYVTWQFPSNDIVL